MSLKFVSTLVFGCVAPACAFEQDSSNIFNIPPGARSYTYEIYPSTNFIALNLEDSIIEYAVEEDLDNMSFQNHLGEEFKALKKEMIFFGKSSVHKTDVAELFALKLRVEATEEIQLSAPTNMELVCSSLEAGGNIHLTSSSIRGDAAFLTTPGKVIFEAPEGCKSRLKSIELHPSTSTNCSFTYCFHGVIDFTSWPSKSVFGVFGAKSVTLHFKDS